MSFSEKERNRENNGRDDPYLLNPQPLRKPRNKLLTEVLELRGEHVPGGGGYYSSGRRGATEIGARGGY